MAVTTYGVNDPLSNKLWSKKLSVEALKQTWAYKFTGSGTDAIIQIKDETQKAAGDKITYGLRMQLTGAGTLGDGTLEGNEEALSTYSDSVLINQLRHAVRSAGRMSQQRVPFSVRDEALSGLRDWYASRFDYAFFNQVGSNTAQTDTRYTGMNAVTAADTNHHIYANAQTGDVSISTTDTFALTLLDSAVERAKSMDPTDPNVYTGTPIRPCMINGSEYYVAVLHPFQVTTMRTNTNTAQWADFQKAAMTGGEITDNPIFTGALGVYNNVVLHSDVRIPVGNNDSTTQYTNCRHAVFLGAQAAALAFGRDNGPERFTWVEELFDYENQLGVSAGSIWGLKKMTFNSLDFSTIVISTYGKKS